MEIFPHALTCRTTPDGFTSVLRCHYPVSGFPPAPDLPHRPAGRWMGLWCSEVAGCY